MAALSSNSRFIFGIVLLTCGWIICFDLFLLIIGISFFLLGTILIMFSKKSLLVKILTVGIPIVLWVIGFELIMHEINRKDAVSVIVKKGFSGQVRIVYGEENGIVPEMQGNRMIFTIPENGILIVRPYIKSGLSDIEYYFLDDKGVKIKMNAMKLRTDNTAIRPSGFFEGTVSSVPKPGAPADQPAELDYIYDAFYILGNDSAQVETYQDEMKKNPLTDSLVKVSRNIK